MLPLFVPLSLTHIEHSLVNQNAFPRVEVGGVKEREKYFSLSVSPPTSTLEKVRLACEAT